MLLNEIILPSILLSAIKRNNLPFVKELIKYNNEFKVGLLTKKNDELQNIFHQVALNDTSEHVVRLLVQNMEGHEIRSIINQKDIYRMTPLMLAVVKKKNGSILRLKKLGATLGDGIFAFVQSQLIQIAADGDTDGVFRYYKAGFQDFNQVVNVEMKTLAHIVRKYKKKIEIETICMIFF